MASDGSGYNRPTRHGVVLALSRRNPSRSFAAGVVELLIMLSVRQRVSCRVVCCDVGEGWKVIAGGGVDWDGWMA